MTIPNLSNSLRSAIQDAFDYLITEFDKECRLIYTPLREQCPNCIWDSSREASSGKYKAGGPIPFTSGTCPYCQGRGFSLTEQSETIHCKLIFLSLRDIANFLRDKEFLDNSLLVPYGVVEVRFFHTLVPKILRATELITQVPIEPFFHQRYQRLGEPSDRFNIIQGRYFTTFWRRI